MYPNLIFKSSFLRDELKDNYGLACLCYFTFLPPNTGKTKAFLSKHIHRLSEVRTGHHDLWLDFLASSGHGLPLADPTQHQAAFGLALP